MHAQQNLQRETSERVSSSVGGNIRFRSFHRSHSLGKYLYYTIVILQDVKARPKDHDTGEDPDGGDRHQGGSRAEEWGFLPRNSANHGGEYELLGGR